MGDTAASRIRASVAALPVMLQEPWNSYDHLVRAGQWATASAARMHGDAVADDLAAHIALLASPDVATALADLLDALSPPAPSDTIGGLARIVAAKAALEAAISKGADRG